MVRMYVYWISYRRAGDNSSISVVTGLSILSECYGHSFIIPVSLSDILHRHCSAYSLHSAFNPRFPLPHGYVLQSKSVSFVCSFNIITPSWWLFLYLVVSNH